MNAQRHLILMPDGREISPDQYSLAGNEPGFQALVEKEALGKALSGSGKPEYAAVLGKLGIGWEPMSDSGHMRYAPPGALVFDLLSDYANQAARSVPLPVMPVKGTNLFDLREPAVAEHAQLYGDRLYKLGDPESGREFVLRYAACHQQFAMVRDWSISHRQLPFGLLEVADSYRLEQSGECMLGFRVRRLNMPDMHVFCRDEEQARLWFAELHRRIMDDVEAAGHDYDMLINFPDYGAYLQMKPFVRSLLLYRGRPALLHFYAGDKNFYWNINIEYHIADVTGHPREIATVQMDVGNARRFGISYSDKDGTKREPVILHTAITGSIERYLYLLVDAALRNSRSGRPAALPFWLVPEQLRLLAVSDAHVNAACALAQRLSGEGIRVGVDDREETVARKVRQARTDWAGAYAVLGDEEAQGAPLKVSWRHLDCRNDLDYSDLVAQTRSMTRGKPFRPLGFPERMSQRPLFR